MKKCINLLIFFVLVSITTGGISYGQSVWATRYLTNIGGNELRKLKFLTPTTGYACGGAGTFMKTTDGGDTWNILNVGLTGYIDALYFINENTGWLGSTESKIQKTTNGGANWVSQPIPPSVYIADINFTSDQVGYAAANGGQIYKTTNGGTNWTNIAPLSIHWGEIQFINQNTGWVLSDYDLYKTTNGGGNWISILHNFGMQIGYFQDYFFLSEQVGWVTIPNGIAKTTDGGQTWNLKVTPIQYPTSVIFLDENRGWVAGHNGTTGVIMATANSGASWSTQRTEPNNFYWDISFANINTGWACGKSIISTTSTGGLVTVSQTSATIPESFSLKQNYPNPFNPTTKISFDIKNSTFASLKIFDMTGKEVKTLAMTFLNQQTGWITGTGGIRKTTDGGDTWASYGIPMQNPYALKFFNSNIGWCAGSNGSNGVIARTLNGGVNWTVQATEVGNVFWEMSFINQNSGWASGNAIISSTQNGALVSISQTSTTIPESYSLKQNYPNPFNPSTKISFDIKNSTFASLKVFDMTGKEVKTLVNENIAAGSYEINFNASELNSGVYFYTLKTNDFTETKKMMLVK
ncbi:unnamed protein product [Rotaria sp. Silwood1]|nr:unnamed protein product [Rotaria sp. Silwood1]CAF4560653.1 unnamed protein product [Rotaria sp. Silwood1]